MIRRCGGVRVCLGCSDARGESGWQTSECGARRRHRVPPTAALESAPRGASGGQVCSPRSFPSEHVQTQPHYQHIRSISLSLLLVFRFLGKRKKMKNRKKRERERERRGEKERGGSEPRRAAESNASVGHGVRSSTVPPTEGVFFRDFTNLF